MRAGWLAALLLILAGAAAGLGAAGAGCGLGTLDYPRCPAGLLPGELVITEIMANPGPDAAGGEWIEIYNPTSRAIDLHGVVLAVGEGDARKTHVIGDVIIEPGAYMVARSGAGPGDAYGYGADLGDLPDMGGQLAVACDVIVVDEVAYEAMVPGVALGLSGSGVPDHEANDEPERWCEAMTPGAPNPVCPGDPGDGSGSGSGGGGCQEDGMTRAPVAPGPGDLVITEVMPNPDAVSDNDGEWIEVYVAADVDLNGLTVGREPGTPRGVLEDEACVRVAAGTYVVLAASASASENGGLPRVDHEADLGLTNSSGSVFVGVGEEVLDQVAWTASQAGASLALDPAALSPEGNDDPEQWCGDAENVYGSGDTGTPGAANPSCAQPPPPDENTCDDAGTPRPVVRPEPGQVRITEYMPNPDAVSDAAGEWIELRVDADVDLNGLELGKVPGEVLVTIAAEACLRVTAGTHVVLAHESSGNGGLPRVDALFDFGLVNSGGSLFVGAAGAVLDQVSYASSTAGVATSLDPASDPAGDPAGSALWCPSPAEPYGAGDRGTPGAPNPPCPAP